jgi:hypothetical protein
MKYPTLVLLSMMLVSLTGFSQSRLFDNKDSIGLVYKKVFSYFESCIDTTSDKVFQRVGKLKRRNIFFREIDSTEIKNKKELWTLFIYRNLILQDFSDSAVVNVTASKSFTNFVRFSKDFKSNEEFAYFMAYPPVSNSDRIYLYVVARINSPRNSPQWSSAYSFVFNTRLDLLSVIYKPLIL